MKDEITRLRVGTRASRLALWQTDHVVARLREAWPELAVERVPIRTLGDRVTDVPLPRIGDKGLFTRELEDGLRDGSIDIAVHSLKDLPTASPPGLVIGAVLEREDPRDALVAAAAATLDTLPRGSRLGTSSLRRKAQVLARRSDLTLQDLRGNVPTRLDKVLRGELDAAVLALAGLRRLGLEGHAVQILDPDTLLCAPGQGALAVQTRDDERLRRILAPLNHTGTRWATCAERALLALLEGGCHVPVAALAEPPVNGTVRLRGLVASLDGRTIIRCDISAPVASEEDAVRLGEAGARELLDRGAGEVLAALAVRAPAGARGDA